jgi:hypothetical protein
MYKKIIVLYIIFIITGIIIYAEDIKDAEIYLKNGEINKAEKIYKDLFEKDENSETLIMYTNSIIWQKKYNEALNIIEKSNIEGNEIEEQKAKIYFWKGDIEKAEYIYSNLEKNGYDTGENGKKVKEILKEKSLFKKFRLKSGVYCDFEKNKKIENYYSLEYNYYDKFSTIITIEDWKNNDNIVKQIELYYANWYFLAGISDTWKRAVAAEYIYKGFKVGIKDIDGTKIYKIGMENSIDKFNILNEANFIKGESPYYKSKIAFEKKAEVTGYYNFNNLLIGELKLRKNIYKGLFISGGIKCDIKNHVNLYMTEMEYQF